MPKTALGGTPCRIDTRVRSGVGSLGSGILQRMGRFFEPQPAPEGGLHAPATARNREPILGVLARVLPPAGLVVEIASGTGEHAAFFAPRLSGRSWQPT